MLSCLCHETGIILWMRPTNKRRSYIATSSLSGLAHSQNEICNFINPYVSPSFFKKITKCWTPLLTSFRQQFITKCQFLVYLDHHWLMVMACRLFGTKPLPEPMVAYYQLGPWELISVKFGYEFHHFHSRKCIWKCRLQNGSHYVLASMC